MVDKEMGEMGEIYTNNSDIECYICLKISNFNGKLVIVKPLVEFNLWMHYLYTNICHASKQNLSELLKRNI